MLEDERYFDLVVGLIGDDSATTLNAVQLITSLAEHPRGRVLS